MSIFIGANPIIRYQIVSIRRSPRPPPSKWQVAMASCLGACNLHIFPTTGKIRRRNLSTHGKGGGGHYEWRLGLAHFHNEYSFLMISPKLYDFSLFFLLIPSPFWTAHLLILIRLLGDGYSLLGSKSSLRGTLRLSGIEFSLV